MRAQFAVDGITINQLHGSDTEENAEREILYFFPIEQTVALIKPDAYENKGDLITSTVLVTMVRCVARVAHTGLCTACVRAIHTIMIMID